MAGGKGGSTSSQVEIPAWLENAAIENINRARDVQKIGYTPYYGPDAAAFTPMQEQAMGMTGSAAQAFGLAPQGFDPMAGMPQAQEFEGGIRGYSSAPLYEQSVDTLRQERPAQAMAIEGQFIDPYTGQYTAPDYAPTVDQIAQAGYTERANQASADAQNMAEQRAHENALARWNAMQDHSTNVTVNPADINQYDYSHGDEISFASSYNPANEFGIYGEFTNTPTTSLTTGDTSYAQAQPSDLQVGDQFQGDDGNVYTVGYEAGQVDPNLANLVGGTSAVTSPYEFPSITSEPLANGQLSNPNNPQFDYSDFGGNSNLYSDPAEEWLMNQPVTPAYNPVNDYGIGGEFAGTPTIIENNVAPIGLSDEEALAANYLSGTGMPSTPTPDIIYTEGGGLAPPIDFGLMDLAGTAMASTPTSLIINALTGGSTDAEKPNIPVEDIWPHTSGLPSVTHAPVNPLTQTYNQAYWADKVAKGVSQADLAAEQAAIANAGGKVYTGSAPKVNKTTSSSTGGK